MLHLSLPVVDTGRMDIMCGLERDALELPHCVGVVFMYRVTIKIFPGPDFPGGRGVLIA